MAALGIYGAMAWVPTFFIRRYGWTAGDTGLVLGLIVGICGTAGMVAGGRLADWLRGRGKGDANYRVALLAVVAWLPFGALYPIMSSGRWAAALLAPMFFFGSTPFGLGPTLVATLTQDVFQDKNAVHLSLLVTGVSAQVCAAVVLWRGLKHYRRSLDYLSAWSKAKA